MLSLDLAQALKRAGLVWNPRERDLFAMPEHDMEGHIFVVSPLPALVQYFGGQQMITFHGSIEWALDYVVLTEAVWLPTESQLRELLAATIGANAPLRIARSPAGYRLEVGIAANVVEFTAPDPADAYGLALLQLLERKPGAGGLQ
jgi:hypothetical protein